MTTAQERALSDLSYDPYDLVIDTYSPNGLPTDAQMRAYLELMQETANVPADATLERVFDFTLARRVADELGLPSQ